MSSFARPCRFCGARIPAGGVCPVCTRPGAVRRSSCRICGAITAGSPYCVAHSAEGERTERQPWRKGYSDPAYRRARAEALERAGGRCEECGEELGEGAEVDHVVALRDGGANVIGNLLVRCRRCHRRKSAADRRRRALGGKP